MASDRGITIRFTEVVTLQMCDHIGDKRLTCMSRRYQVFVVLWFVFAVISQLPAQQPSEEFVSDVVWSIAHEGCDVFVKNEMRSIRELQDCFTSTQSNPDARALIGSASFDAIKASIPIAIYRIRDEYNVKTNFDWVMDHEGRRSQFVQLLKSGDFSEIRSIYRALQSHNDMARNALSALSDHDISSLIEGRYEAAGSTLAPQIAIALRDHLLWTILHGGCEAFDGETIRRPQDLRECALRVERQNHNGEAVDLLSGASSDILALSLTRAVSRAKQEYRIKERFQLFLTNMGQLPHFKALVKEQQLEQARRKYAQLEEGDDTPFLLNVLADSEIAAIVNQHRLDISIPREMSEDKLTAFINLLDTRTVNITDETTAEDLQRILCSSDIHYLPDLMMCETSLRSVLKEKGLSVNDRGVVTGARTVDLPSIPPVGVPTLVTFRPGVTPSQAATALASAGIAQQDLHPAALIEPVPSTFGINVDCGTNGPKQYGSAISADKIQKDDVNLTGLVHVGIVDAGVDTNHPALKPFLWQIPMIFPNARWDKGSVGFDYLKRISDPAEEPVLKSHGTHITGLVTARVLSLWHTQLNGMNLKDHINVYSLKIAGVYGRSGEYGIPDFSFPSQALYEGMPNRMHLFNLSLKGPTFPMLRDQIIAHSRESLIIVAAGNDALDLNLKENLDCVSCNGTFRNGSEDVPLDVGKVGTPLDNVLLVGALDKTGLRTDSNKGDRVVEIAAPGSDICSTVLGGHFGVLSGTSQAAPLVTSTAAILLAEHDAFPSETKERILDTCDWDEGLKNQHLIAEGCKLNMAKAVISETDVVELTTGEWQRGIVKRDEIELTDAAGSKIDPSTVVRIWFTDHAGNVRVAIKGGGHKDAKLSSTKLHVNLRTNDKCLTGATNPCEIDTNKAHDVIFRWQG